LQWNTTVANKLFDYVALGIPVVAADVRPVERIPRETAGGGVFRSRAQVAVRRASSQVHASAVSELRQ
jgi:hypothetical protein